MEEDPYGTPEGKHMEEGPYGTPEGKKRGSPYPT